METRSIKRRRLMSISSYVSSWPNVPARFESLNDDTLTTVLEFVGNKSYATYARINKHCKEIYVTTKGMTKETFLYGYGPLTAIKESIERAIEGNDWELYKSVGKGVVLYNRRDMLEWGLQERKNFVLKGICNIAAGEDRLDVLDEVWNNVEDEDVRSGIFKFVDRSATRCGKLDVLKWVEEKGLDINNYWCTRDAARYGHLHIIQWLQEEKGFELDGMFYEDALGRGGHLHIMKWLQEEEAPFYNNTFKHAARTGILDILQWLHDEGCPWNHRYRIGEKDLKPEVIEWCRSNGYSDRIIVG